jgi:ribonuclease J
MIITHGHEDHIGGIPYLLKRVSIPVIFAGKLTIKIVERKLKEHSGIKPHVFQEINDNSILVSKNNEPQLKTYLEKQDNLYTVINVETKHFIIDFYRVCHSIPDAFGICFKTPNGIICTTGDFRFDFLTSGDESDINKMAIVGRREVDILMCECTNAQTPGFSISEKYVIDELSKIIRTCAARIIVTIFASNLHRIEEIIEVAIQNGRKIVIFGRSMDNNVRVAIETKLLNVPNGTIISPLEMNNLSPSEVLILTTGTQGEEMAALNQMAMGNHRAITLQPDDTIIFSSNPIPGNFESVQSLLNKLYRVGVNIFISNHESKIHSSGHATQTELQLLIKLINPLYLVPIHGEFKMLAALRQEGNEVGIVEDRVIQVSNGQKIGLLNNRAKILDERVEIYDVFVDGNKVNADKDNILKNRQILSQNGIVGITIVLDRTTKRITETPVIAVRGSFDARTIPDLILKTTHGIRSNLEEVMKNKNTIINDAEIKSIIQKTALFFIEKYFAKKPLIHSTIFYVDGLPTN